MLLGRRDLEVSPVLHEAARRGRSQSRDSTAHSENKRHGGAELDDTTAKRRQRGSTHVKGGPGLGRRDRRPGSVVRHFQKEAGGSGRSQEAGRRASGTEEDAASQFHCKGPCRDCKDCKACGRETREESNHSQGKPPEKMETTKSLVLSKAQFLDDANE